MKSRSILSPTVCNKPTNSGQRQIIERERNKQNEQHTKQNIQNRLD